MENEKVCTLIIDGEAKVQPSAMDLQKKIEQASSTYMQRKDPKKLIEALEELLLFMVNGNSYPKLLMTVIRFIITCDDHRIKKLLGLYWEICDKVRETGELKEEMVLVCNAIRNDLIHSNEYIRGRTLRLLCRMRYFKIMEPLIESILKNLSHRNAYVRRNAVMCVYSVVKTFGPDVIPQASVEIEQLLLIEGDLSTKRIAFIMLLNCDIDRAIAYALSVEEQITSLGDVFQLAILELVRRAARTRPGVKSKLMRLVFYLASGSSPAVMFECAEILAKHGSTPSASQVAASSYVHLLNSQPDNNVKLIVLEKLDMMRRNDGERHIVEAMVMDVLRAVACPAFGVRRKTIELVSKSMNSRNIGDIVTLLKKEVVKASAPENAGGEGSVEYKRLLIRTLQLACRQFPEFADHVVISFLDLLRDPVTDSTTAYDITDFVREVMCTHPALHGLLIEKLSSILPDLRRSKVARSVLWLMGEYSGESCLAQIGCVLKCLGPLPLSPPTVRMPDLDVDKESAETKVETAGTKTGGEIVTKTVVLSDGTYASQAVYGSSSANTGSGTSGLRGMVLAGDVLLANVIGVVLAKLIVRSGNRAEAPVRNEVMFAIANLIKVVKAAVSSGVSRLVHCLRVVAEPTNASLARICQVEWNSESCRDSLLGAIKSDHKDTVNKSEERSLGKPSGLEAVEFRQLKEKRETLAATDARIAATLVDKDEHTSFETLIPGVVIAGLGAAGASTNLFSERLAKATPMTGLADSVYVEGFLRLVGFDLILELTVVNRTAETLQNILVELCTHGDLKVVEKPTAVTLAPGDSATTFATIKVASTESGVVFGYATFDRKSALDKEWLVLNEIHADVLDYIKKDTFVTESAFKAMWQEFEWENKIVVNTTIRNADAFVDLLAKHTNLSLVGSSERVRSTKEILRTSQFAAVNLYAKSIFGEDALANVSIEKSATDGELVGAVRIRSRTQGIALSLGDKINHVQREHKLRGA